MVIMYKGTAFFGDWHNGNCACVKEKENQYIRAMVLE
jgi:hypothetical protein